MAHEDLLAELERRREGARRMGGPEELAKRRHRGQLNAEERMDALIDSGTFIEVGLLGSSGVFKQEEGKTPRDGKLVGFRPNPLRLAARRFSPAQAVQELTAFTDPH